MKTLLLLLASSAQIYGASVTLGWDPNPEVDLLGYKLYKKVTTINTNSAPPVPIISWTMDRIITDLGAATSTNEAGGAMVTTTITNLPSGLHCWTVTAYNAWGESTKSNEACVQINPPPVVPRGLHIQEMGPDTNSPSATLTFTNIPSIAFLQSSQDLTNWTSWLTVARMAENVDQVGLMFSTPKTEQHKFWRIARPMKGAE